MSGFWLKILAMISMLIDQMCIRDRSTGSCSDRRMLSASVTRTAFQMGLFVRCRRVSM